MPYVEAINKSDSKALLMQEIKEAIEEIKLVKTGKKTLAMSMTFMWAIVFHH